MAKKQVAEAVAPVVEPAVVPAVEPAKAEAPTFTRQEAQAMITTIRTAPIQNMDHADGVMRLIQRFAAWYDFVNQPTNPK